MRTINSPAAFFFIPVMLLCLLSKPSQANDIDVSNIALTGQNSQDGTVLVQFDLYWENSWRISDGSLEWWDAAWVFVKYRVSGDPEWYHASLNNQGHSSGSGTSALVQTGLINESQSFDIDSNPGMGAFIYRSSLGSGTFSVSGAQLQWDYTVNGVNDTDLVDVQVFAVEMIYIPEGSFYVGDGNADVAQFYEGDDPGTPFHITSEGAIEVGESAGQIYYSQPGIQDQDGPIPAEFPKGYAGFYIMKHHVTQQQYADFLNSLTPDQSDNRYDQSRFSSSSGATDNRNKITLNNQFYSTDNPFIPIHHITARDPWAYASWSSTRIMTELEFEKAARGPNSPEQGAYAWGTVQINEDRYVVGNQDQIDEFIAENYNEDLGNAINEDTNFFVDGETDLRGAGPARVGIFATENSNRIQSGASYYGVMEMSGNVADFVLSVGSSWERSAGTGIHGNGSLAPDGAHTFAVGEIERGSPRGGNYLMSSESGGIRNLEISVRGLVADEASESFDNFTSNAEGVGFRVVRSQPSTPAE